MSTNTLYGQISNQYGSDYYINRAMDYQQQYYLEITPGTSGHNDETDAFRHAFMQASFTYNFGSAIAKFIGDDHEKNPNNPPLEKNMDLWNNDIGRKIGQEVRNETAGQNLTKQQIEDLIAEKIIEEMRNKNLITNPDDPRKYNDSITINNMTLTGGSKYPTDPVWTDGNIVYEWAGTGVPEECYDLTVTDTSTGDTFTIPNFHNGDLGIRLKMKEPTLPRTYTTEEVNARWYDILGFWQASNWPASSSDSFIAFDTLPWSIGLTNLDVDPNGAGKWLPSIVIGNVPNLSCPIVPFDNTKILEFNKNLTQIA